MEVLRYNELDSSKVQAAFDRVVERLRAGDFRSADVKKLKPTPYYRAKLNDTDRLLFQIGRYHGKKYLLLLEIILNHAYGKSRFLNGARVDEGKLEPMSSPEEMVEKDAHSLAFVHPGRPHFHLLDKILSFDDAQHEVFHLAPPLILIGSAGSGKTVLSLEKLKSLAGDILYVTLSAYLAENARNLYYSSNYDNEAQDISFLSYKEYLETLRVPEGKPMTFRDFEAWFVRHRHASGIKNAHKLFEEFNGVLTGANIHAPHLSRDEYLDLGVKRSIFAAEERTVVHDLFYKYLEHLKQGGFYDLNLAAHQALALCRPRYDYVVVDEVQDLTNIQLHSILRSLRREDHFILCGDSNQIVHPNFFSWANVKTLFYQERPAGKAEIVRVLTTNYRNSAKVTDLANRLLLIKNARFGAIDRESNYLVKSVDSESGVTELLTDDPKVKRALNDKTRRSTRFAVVCLRSEDKAEARQFFQTPLIFSIQEAKGLEYESVILYGFVTGNSKDYDAIVEGVTAADLTRDLVYSRARDKTDKSLEVYKFFINALYVAMTRAVHNLYVVERRTQHRLFELLGLAVSGQELQLAAQQSSAEDWKREAHKLELQGKKEQAEEIRRSILNLQPVPWRVLTPSSLDELKKEAFDPERFNNQAKKLLYEYALIYDVPYIFQRLVELKFNRARTPEQDVRATELRYTQDCLEKGCQQLRHKMGLYGVDFRNPLNQTPLMLAAKVGRADLVQSLVQEGAHTRLRDNWGRTSLQIALRESYRHPDYARNKIGEVYAALAPASVNVKTDGRLVKLDRRQMEYFLLTSMLARLQDLLRVKIMRDIPGFETADFVHALAHFPEHVIPEYRRRRPYLSGVLARNEVNRRQEGNRKLFLRIHWGLYIPNPCMEIEVAEGEWINVYDLIHITTLEAEKDNPRLQRLIQLIRDYQRFAVEGGTREEVPEEPDEEAEGPLTLPVPRRLG
ncbi:MAG: UvrD-helicase domain-containing protein [Terrimicrobiaceae bacterium]